MTGPRLLPEIPDDDADFTPDLARKIIATYQSFLHPDGRDKLAQEASLLRSQLANCHKEISRLRDELLRYSAGSDDRAHKVMTPEEYAAMPLIGWHEVCRDVDGFGAIGVRFLGGPA